MAVMQYMVSVNTFIRSALIPAIIGIYFLFLIYDYNFYHGNGRIAIIEEHISNISINNIDSLVIGGSNSYFSLSAEILSQKSNDNWYNLSLFSEGYTDKNYINFLKEQFYGLKGKNIQIVVYSSIYPNRDESFIRERQHGRIDLTGRQKSIKPNNSIISHLKKALEGNLDYPIPNQYGDFNFNNFQCKLSGKSDFRPATIDISSPWLSENLINIQSIFPNAHIYVVSPPEFFATKDEIFNANLHFHNLSKAVRKLVKESKSEINFSFIDERSYQSQENLCDDYHHANSLGRIYRTENLFARIKTTPN